MPEKEIVVITGAGAGVGRAIADEFANNGADLALISRDEERLNAAGRYVRERGGRTLTLPCDVSDANALENAADRVEKELGPIDIWINCAMATIFAPVVDITPEEFRRATEVTYLGFVWGTMAALRRMKPRDRGTIVQIGSALAYRSIPLQSAYCGAKHAIAGFTDSVRCELLHDNSRVHITMVHLPGVNTPQFSWCRTKLPRHPAPLGTVYEPEMPAQAVYWAAHHRRREVFVAGSTVEAIYGQDVLPGVADRFLARNGYDGQQTNEPVAPDRPDNLFRPVPGPFGARGIFSDRAKAFSVQNWANLHRGITAAMSAIALAGISLAWRKARTH